MKRIIANFWEITLAAWVVALCVGVFMQVLLRYAIKVSFPAIEEIVSISFIYTIFIGAAVGMKRSEHLSIDFLVRRLAPPAARALHLATATATAVFLVFMVIEGVGFVRDSTTQTTTYLGLPMSCSYAAIPISGGLMLYYLLRNTWRAARGGAVQGGGH